MRVLVFGTFDHLHPGHMFFLRYAQSKGDLTIVVARDETVQRIKGRPPRQVQDERMEAIKKAFPTATVLLGHVTDYLARLREVQPDLIVFGYDQRLPPGVTETDFPCRTERAEAFEPDKYKSSLL